MLFNLPAAALVASRKGGRIEDDSVELFTTTIEMGQDIKNVVCDETVACGGIELVEGEIFAPAVEGLFGEVYADGLRAGECGGYAEGASVGEGVQDALGRDAAKKGAVRTLVEKESVGVAGGEIESVMRGGLGDSSSDRERWVAAEESWRAAILILAWKKFAESAVRVPLGGFTPFSECGGEVVASGVVFKTNKCIVAEALDPAVRTGGNTVRSGAGSREFGELLGLQPDDG